MDSLAGVADVLAGEEEDNLFGDILRMIADAFEGLGDKDQLDVGGGHLGGIAGLTEELLVILAIKGVDFGVTF